MDGHQRDPVRKDVMHLPGDPGALLGDPHGLLTLCRLGSALQVGQQLAAGTDVEAEHDQQTEAEQARGRRLPTTAPRSR